MLPPPPVSTAELEPPDAGAVEAEEQGPVELRAPTLFSTDDNPTPLQTATSLLLTGAISVFLFRSLRRRARRAKELVIQYIPTDSISILYLHHTAYALQQKSDEFLLDCRRECGRAG